MLAGLGALALIGLALWGISYSVSHSSKVEATARLSGRYFTPGGAERLSKAIAKDGPLLFPSLIGDAGRRPIGIGHVGTDPLKGWRVFSLVPPGAAPDCILALDQPTRLLTAPCAPDRYPEDGAGLTVLPVTAVTIDPNRDLVIDLRAFNPGA